MYEVTVVDSAGKGEFMWPGPEIIVMIGLGGKKCMQYVLLDVVEAGLSHSSQSPPSFHLIQLSSPQLVHIV